MIDEIFESPGPSMNVLNPRGWAMSLILGLTANTIQSRLQDGAPLVRSGLVSMDNDGDLDVFVVNNASEPLFYRNQSRDVGGWLRLSLEGVTSNRQGLGAKVSVFADGLPEQIRQAGVSSHFLGQSEDALHFGLAASGTADIVIRWPASGLVTTLNDVPANSWIRVTEGASGFELVTPQS